MKIRIAVGALSLVLPLAGCVLAIGNSPDDEGAQGKRLKAIEKRLEALEAKLGPCIPTTFTMDGGGMVMPGGKGTIVISGPDGKPHVVNLGKGDMKIEMKQEDGEEGEEGDEGAEGDEQDEKEEMKGK